jgi:hypothetical protein
MKVMQVDNLRVMPDPLGLFSGRVERQYVAPSGAARQVVAMVRFDGGAGSPPPAVHPATEMETLP